MHTGDVSVTMVMVNPVIPTTNVAVICNGGINSFLNLEMLNDKMVKLI